MGAYQDYILGLSPSSLEAYYSFGGQVWPTFGSFPAHQDDFIENLQGNADRNLAAYEQYSFGGNEPTFDAPGPTVTGTDGSFQGNLNNWANIFTNERRGLIGQFDTSNLTEFKDTGCTMSFFLRYIAYQDPPDTAPFFPIFFVVAGTHYRGFSAVPEEGWEWRVNPQSGDMYFHVAHDNGADQFLFNYPDPLPEGQWVHVVSRLTPLTFSGPSATTWRRELQLDGVTVYDDSGDIHEMVPCQQTGFNLTFGCGYWDDLRFTHSRIGIDEFAMWSAPVEVAETIPRALKIDMSWLKFRSWDTDTPVSDGAPGIGVNHITFRAWDDE